MRIARTLIIALIALGVSWVVAPGSAWAQQAQQTCVHVGGGIVQCTGYSLPDYSGESQDGQRVLGEAVGKLLFGDKKKRFRREVGGLLAKGKCLEAGELAYREGELELGSQILNACPQTPPANSITVTPENVEQVLQNMADGARVPAPFGEMVVIESVEAIGSQLILNGRLDGLDILTEEHRGHIKDLLCADEMAPTLFAAGGSVRMKLFDLEGALLGSIMVDRSSCGY